MAHRDAQVACGVVQARSARRWWHAGAGVRDWWWRRTPAFREGRRCDPLFVKGVARAWSTSGGSRTASGCCAVRPSRCACDCERAARKALHSQSCKESLSSRFAAKPAASVSDGATLSQGATKVPFSEAEVSLAARAVSLARRGGGAGSHFRTTNHMHSRGCFVLVPHTHALQDSPCIYTV